MPLSSSLFYKSVEQQGLETVAMERLHIRPELGLSVLDKCSYAVGEKSTFLVPLGP
jgi:hypothetical protein